MNRKDSIVFKSGKIGSIEIKNRLVKSATYENAATNGEVTADLLKFYTDLAKGGTGMIVTGAAAVYPKNISMKRGMRVFEDRFIPELKELTKAVHGEDEECKIILQLFHPGRQVATAESRENVAPFAPPALIEYIMKHPEIMETEGDEQEVEPTGPSAVFDTLLKQTARALSIEEIQEIIDGFADGILRAQESGFDGVQLHAAHGWLLSSFLSPHANKREDLYGGTHENRIRIIKEIYEKGRKKVGGNFPIMIKMDTTDFFPDGISIKESVKMASSFSSLGFDAIEASGGGWESLALGEEILGFPPYLIPESRIDINTKEKEAYFQEGAAEIKKKIEPPVILVGGIRSFSKAEELLKQGRADFISMARPFVCQPDLPNIWLSGGPDKAKCISCNACFSVGEQTISCKL